MTEPSCMEKAAPHRKPAAQAQKAKAAIKGETVARKAESANRISAASDKDRGGQGL